MIRNATLVVFLTLILQINGYGWGYAKSWDPAWDKPAPVWPVPNVSTHNMTATGFLRLRTDRTSAFFKLWHSKRFTFQVRDLQKATTTAKDYFELYAAPTSPNISSGCVWYNKTQVDPLSHWIAPRQGLVFTASPYEEVCLELKILKGTTQNPVELTIQSSEGLDWNLLSNLVGGIILWNIAPQLARNTIAHMTIAGSMGIVLLGAVLLYTLVFSVCPKSLRGLLVIFFGPWTSFLLRRHFVLKAIVDFFFSFWGITMLVVGAATPVIYVYTHPLSNKGEDVIHISFRLLAIVLLLFSTQIRWVSLVIVSLTLAGSFYWKKLCRGEDLAMPARSELGQLFGFEPEIFPERVNIPVDIPEDVPDTHNSCQRIAVADYNRLGEDTTRRELRRLREYMRGNPDAWTTRVDSLASSAQFCGLTEYAY